MGKSLRSRVRAKALLLVLGVAITATSCGGGGGGGGGPDQGVAGLGDLAKEVAYFNTQGHGTITIRDDFSVMDVACAHLIAGKKVILLNPAVLGSLPQAVQDHFLGHEHGHHYLDHVTTAGPPKTKEYVADAYCVRVMYSLVGADAVRSVIAWYESTGTPASATHPSHRDRASYMRSVLAAVEADPSDVPAPPTDQPDVPGFLAIRNTLPEPALYYLDGIFAGSLGVGGSGTLQIPAGQYALLVQGYVSGVAFGPYPIQIVAGQTTYFP